MGNLGLMCKVDHEGVSTLFGARLVGRIGQAFLFQLKNTNAVEQFAGKKWPHGLLLGRFQRFRSRQILSLAGTRVGNYLRNNVIKLLGA